MELVPWGRSDGAGVRSNARDQRGVMRAENRAKAASRRRQHRPREREVVLVHVASFSEAQRPVVPCRRLLRAGRRCHGSPCAARSSAVRWRYACRQTPTGATARASRTMSSVVSTYGLCSMSTHRYVPHACACSASARTWEAARVQVQIQSQLGELDGGLAIRVLGVDAVDGVVIVARDGVGFGGIRDVFAQPRVHGGNAERSERRRGREHVVQLLAGHEASDRTPNEPVARRPLPQPRALRSRQQHRSHQTHGKRTRKK